MTTARDVIAKCFRSDEEPMMYDSAEHNADLILAALLSAPEPVRLELAAKLNPWRTIETAPKEIDEKAWYLGGYWDGGYGLIQWAGDGWRDTNWHKTGPAHWLPLPAPPSEDKPK